jgi:hypothetical protein
MYAQEMSVLTAWVYVLEIPVSIKFGTIMSQKIIHILGAQLVLCHFFVDLIWNDQFNSTSNFS